MQTQVLPSFFVFSFCYALIFPISNWKLQQFFLVDLLKTYEDYDEYDETLPKQCKTLDGIPCKLPFNFKGNEKTKCITTLIGPFCPTQLDSSSGVPVKWGYCNDQCPTEGSEIGKLLENEMQYPYDDFKVYGKKIYIKRSCSLVFCHHFLYYKLPEIVLPKHGILCFKLTKIL